MNISQCKALVTGAGGGIGQALVEALCREGARLLVAGRQLAPLQDLARRFPGQIEVVEADITAAPGRDAVLEAAARFDGLNCLINAAGINRFGLLEQHDEEAIAAIIGLNVTSTLQLTRRLLPQLAATDKALIVNLGSTFGSIGYAGFTAYCASKFALRGFSEALRRELADTPVKVLYIAPRAARTAMNDSQVVAMNEELKVTMDDPPVVAAAIVSAVRRERSESFLGWPEKFFVRLNSLLPAIVDGALRKQLPIIKRFARSTS
jgi:short-subunit dehydrogenase